MRVAVRDDDGRLLITVEDVPEHTVLHMLLINAGVVRSWLGYTDRVTEGSFLWLAPPGVDPASNLCFLGATPVNNASVNCMIEQAVDQCVDWAIFDCNSVQPYVCERDNRVIDHASY